MDTIDKETLIKYLDERLDFISEQVKQAVKMDRPGIQQTYYDMGDTIGAIIRDIESDDYLLLASGKSEEYEKKFVERSVMKAIDNLEDNLFGSLLHNAGILGEKGNTKDLINSLVNNTVKGKASRRTEIKKTKTSDGVCACGQEIYRSGACKDCLAEQGDTDA